MSKCNFIIVYKEPIIQLVDKAKNASFARGGIFTGDTKYGSYSIPTPLGTIKGVYSVTGNTITFEVTVKPFVLACNKIETELRKYLTPKALS